MTMTDTPAVAGAIESAKVSSHLHPEGSFDVADHPVATGREEIWRFTPLKRLRGLHDAGVELVSTGGIIYMKGLPGSQKPWVKIDPKGNDPMSKMFAGLTGDMGDPRQLRAAYDKSDALHDSAKIRNPLLILHGLSDDNVLFQNSTELMAKMPGASSLSIRNYTADGHERTMPMGLGIYVG